MSPRERLAACVADAYEHAGSRYETARALTPLEAEAAADANARGLNQTVIAGMFGVNQSTISRAIRRHKQQEAA